MMVALLAQTSHLVLNYECRFLAGDVAHHVEMIVEKSGSEMFFSMLSDDATGLSAERQKIEPLFELDGKSRYWPRSVKMKSGTTLQMEMQSTNSNFKGFNEAVLLKSSETSVVAAYAESRDEYVSVGMCMETSREWK